MRLQVSSAHGHTNLQRDTMSTMSSSSTLQRESMDTLPSGYNTSPTGRDRHGTQMSPTNSQRDTMSTMSSSSTLRRDSWDTLPSGYTTSPPAAGRVSGSQVSPGPANLQRDTNSLTSRFWYFQGWKRPLCRSPCDHVTRWHGRKEGFRESDKWWTVHCKQGWKRCKLDAFASDCLTWDSSSHAACQAFVDGLLCHTTSRAINLWKFLFSTIFAILGNYQG